jgi:hypothetical protein
LEKGNNFLTPILFITFNRPTHTGRVFDEIKKQKPKYLYVFADGPREGNESDLQKCKKVKSIFDDNIDWDCELKKYYPISNLGCGKGPASAITWFFENVEAGLIFEDDCIPHPDFFEFCKILLNKYKSNTQISFIGGANFQDNQIIGSGSYYFSAGHHGTWGWASWRRSWQYFSYFIKDFNENELKFVLKKYFYNKTQINYWLEIFREVNNDRFNDSCWDYQFYYSCWRHGMIAIIPNKNLISNIGFDHLATHTFNFENQFANKTIECILPLNHPDYIIQDQSADYYMHRHYVQPYEYGLNFIKRLPFKLNKYVKRLVGKEGSWFKNNK